MKNKIKKMALITLVTIVLYLCGYFIYMELYQLTGWVKLEFVMGLYECLLVFATAFGCGKVAFSGHDE